MVVRFPPHKDDVPVVDRACDDATRPLGMRPGIAGNVCWRPTSPDRTPAMYLMFIVLLHPKYPLNPRPFRVRRDSWTVFAWDVVDTALAPEKQKGPMMVTILQILLDKQLAAKSRQAVAL